MSSVSRSTPASATGGTICRRPGCCCLAITSTLTAKRKCPHYGECDIDAARAGKASGTQQLTGRVYDNRAGSDVDGRVSTRHTRRILAAYGEEGAAALAHGNRGRRAPNAISEATKTAVLHLARTRYSGTNHTHMSELLSEREGIDITRSTLRRLLVSAGESSPRGKRPPKHRVRRQRMPSEGMLIQVDGSYHRWLGKDGPQFTLLLAIDDATGIVVNALFCELENTHSYFSLLGGLIRRCGIPIALYSDRHAVFKYTPPSEAAGAPTQFNRAMDEIGIQLIFAQSPQAKGRVERAAGTFQDRLVTELRLAGAITIDDANRVLEGFLPRFNGRFKVPAQESEAAYRAVNEEMCLERVLCFKYRRRVARDNTVRYRWRTLQLLPGTDRPSYAGAAVDVLEGLDDSLAVQHEGRDIPSQEAPPRPSVLRGFARRTTHSPIIHQSTNGLGTKWVAKLATLDANHDAEHPIATSGRNGAGRVRKTATQRLRKPTPLQTTRWKAVQKAKRKGLSIRGIARELGIHRDTVKKYMNTESPPMAPSRLTPNDP